MSEFHFDRTRIKRNFGRAAGTYEKHDALQREVQSTLVDRLDMYEQVPEVILDVGAGTGRGSAALKKRYPKAQVIAMDLALPMLRQARQHSSWLNQLLNV